VNTARLHLPLWALGGILITASCGAPVYASAQRYSEIAVPSSALSVPQFLSKAKSYVPDQSNWSTGRARAYARDSAIKPQRIPEAFLSIASVKLTVPVYADSGALNLNLGAGLITGSAQPGGDGNIGITAHRDGYFQALSTVAVGDLIEIESPAGTREYRVFESSLMNRDDESVLRPTRESVVTLITGYPSYFMGGTSYRYVVRALVLDTTDEPRRLAAGVDDHNPQRWNPWGCIRSRLACAGAVAGQ
jgi:LPXTG-site transpeptidase (sortase) family protein